MKLKLQISKIKNMYSFISNLSQWNDLFCVKQRKKEWLAKTWPLSDIEKKSLRLFAKILRETDFDIENLFLFENDKKIWSGLSEQIDAKQTQQLKIIFKTFEHRFEKVWKQNIKKINLIKKGISKKTEIINKNIKIIDTLCDLPSKDLSPDIIVYILLSSNVKEEIQGRAAGNAIALECSGWPIAKIDYLINNILLHEIFHILFKRNKHLFKKFNKIIEKNTPLLEKSKLYIWPPKIILEETLVSSFAPEGYLSEKNLKINIIKEAKKELAKKRIDAMTHLRNFAAIRMRDYAKDYVDNQKLLDFFFFEKISDIIEEFVKKN